MLRRIAGYDTGLLVAVFGILATSVYVLLTGVGSLDGMPAGSYGVRQFVFMLPGLLAAMLISRVGLERIERFWIPSYIACVLSITVVMVLGTAIRGSRRWIELGPVNVQPSEIGKVLLILAAAGLVTHRIREIERPAVLLSALAMVAVPALLVFAQPDFGTSQIYAVIGLAIIYFAGARWLHLGMLVAAVVTLAVAVLVVLPAAGVQVLHEYQIKRLTGFANPEADPQGSNYHSIQSKIAIGSGQMLGKQEEATQVQDSFLPEPHTDFVFATIGERYGFVGGAFVLGLFALLISRCLRAVAVAPTIYGRLVCGAIAAMFGAQVFINIGMTIGLMPITGVPLPLLSYGGSAMVANLVAVGIIAGVLRSSESAPVRYARRAGLSTDVMLAMRQRSSRRVKSRGVGARR